LAGILTLQAQQNIVKTSLLYGNAGVQYIRAIGKHFSLEAQAGYAFIFISDYKSIHKRFSLLFCRKILFSNSKGKLQGWHIGLSINILETSESGSTSNTNQLFMA
jgi:hypothetical protein